MFELSDIIGAGTQATVYYREGYAYKVFKEGYSEEWISYEKSIMDLVSKMGLPIPKCYPYEDTHVIKMDYIKGITLAERMRKEKYKQGVEDLISLQKTIFPCYCDAIPSFLNHAWTEIEKLEGLEAEKRKALEYLKVIEDKKCLLHLDFHFLNVLFTESGYRVIDWVNAKIGNPVYDLARTYVILNEKAYRAGRKYVSLLKKDKELDLKDLDKAVLVMALLRLKEEDSERTRELVRGTLEEKGE